MPTRIEATAAEEPAHSESSVTYEQFVLHHQAQLRRSGVPELYWPSLCHKLQNDVWDLWQRVMVNRVVSETLEESTAEEGATGMKDNAHLPFPIVLCGQAGIFKSDPNSIFLVDHAWTFDVLSARPMLRAYPALLRRMCNIMDLDPQSSSPDYQEEAVREQQIELVLKHMWKFVNTYSFSSALLVTGTYQCGSSCLTAEDKLPRWYMHDEIACRIAHSDRATCRLVPFYYVQGQITYSLLFPIVDVEYGQEITRDYIEGIAVGKEDEAYRQCRLLPWRDVQLPDGISYEPQPVPLDYFRNSALSDSLPPSNDTIATSLQIPSTNGSTSLKVFSEYDVLSASLTDKRFQLVDTAAEADILWYSRHFNDFKGLAEEFPDKLINQFPYESVVTVKDLLAIICRRTVTEGQPLIDPHTLQSFPKWLATTYNLESDLVNFVAYFLERQKRGMNNLWICKPWNLARSMDMVITDNLSAVVRLPETGPKLCCKYIEDPVLFHRADIDGPVKFDLRFIVLLQSVKPLRLAMYEHFWLRFANQPFGLSDYDVYDKHFTVMNYGQGPIHQMFCHDFVRQFDEQNSGQCWAEVQKEVYRIVRQVFEAATSLPPPAGIAPSSQSRAIYGLDFILKWDRHSNGSASVQPVLLEINYSPDCKRACDYYPDFFNHVLRYLVLNEKPETIIEL